MWKAVRSVAAVTAGFVAASAVMMLIESVNGHVLYPEVGKLAEGLTDKEAIRALLVSAPVGALLLVLPTASNVGCRGLGRRTRQAATGGDRVFPCLPR